MKHLSSLYWRKSYGYYLIWLDPHISRSQKYNTRLLRNCVLLVVQSISGGSIDESHTAERGMGRRSSDYLPSERVPSELVPSPPSPYLCHAAADRAYRRALFIDAVSRAHMEFAVDWLESVKVYKVVFCKVWERSEGYEIC